MDGCLAAAGSSLSAIRLRLLFRCADIPIAPGRRSLRAATTHSLHQTTNVSCRSVAFVPDTIRVNGINRVPEESVGICCENSSLIVCV